MTTVSPRTRQTPARETEVTAAPVRQRVRKTADRYYVDPSIIPDGWIYQWKRHSTLGQEDPGYMAELAQVGFTPVPAERHPGVFLPVGYTGSIIIGGQMLMERPVELEQEAQNENRMAARAQVRGSREQFGLTPRASGFEGPDTHQSARRNSGVKVGREAVDAPAVKYDYGNIDE
jgi:hypothetical protein